MGESDLLDGTNHGKSMTSFFHTKGIDGIAVNPFFSSHRFIAKPIFELLPAFEPHR